MMSFSYVLKERKKMGCAWVVDVLGVIIRSKFFCISEFRLIVLAVDDECLEHEILSS